MKFSSVQDDEDYEASDSEDNIEGASVQESAENSKKKKDKKKEEENEDREEDDEDNEDARESDENKYEDDGDQSDDSWAARRTDGSRINPNAKRVKYEFDESKGPEQFLKIIAMDGHNRVYKLSDLNYPYYESNDGTSENNYESLIEYAKKEMDNAKANESFRKELEKRKTAFASFFETDLRPILVQELQKKVNLGNQFLMAQQKRGDEGLEKKNFNINKFKFLKQNPYFKRSKPAENILHIKNKINSREFFNDLKKKTMMGINFDQSNKKNLKIDKPDFSLSSSWDFSNPRKKHHTELNIPLEEPKMEEELPTIFFHKVVNSRAQHYSASPMKTHRLPNTSH